MARLPGAALTSLEMVGREEAGLPRLTIAEGDGWSVMSCGKGTVIKGGKRTGEGQY